MWQLPESELGVLGKVAGKDVLELGCGAAQWSILLTQWGARPVGLDNSAAQLEQHESPGRTGQLRTDDGGERPMPTNHATIRWRSCAAATLARRP